MTQHAHIIPILRVGKWAHINLSMLTCQGSTRLELPLKFTGPVPAVSSVNAIGTQMLDPINSELTRWRMAV